MWQYHPPLIDDSTAGVHMAGRAEQNLSHSHECAARPLPQLIYPHGFEHLPAVRDAVLKDCDL